jgi:gamma-glutamylaminecyclotransferase
MPAYLFVYGTLKRGHSRSPLLRDEHFIGPAKTVPRYRLVDCGQFPGLVSRPEDGLSVEGELWQVSDACLARLDEIECLNDELYARLPIELLPPFGQWKVETYYYLRPTEGLKDRGGRW